MNKKNLEKAANKAVTESRRGMTWPVYQEYEVEYHDDLPVLVAPGLKLTSRDIDFGVSEHYAPLQHPEIVLRLAALGDLLNVPEKTAKRGRDPLREMHAFAGEYGLLGVSDPTGSRESLEEFTVAARNISRTLRLYEAASANEDGGDEDGGDEDKLQRLYRDTVAHGLPGVDPKAVAKYRHMIERAKRDDLRERAFEEVSDIVSEALRLRTYPAQYRLRNEAGRTVGFDRGDGFHDLLGACYLLLDYLIRDPAARRCNKCQQFINPEKYSDSLYCGDACKQAAYRDRRKKQAG